MSKIETQVMASVAAIYVARKLLGVTALKIYILAVSAFALVSLVSIPHILANLSQVGFSGLGTFFLAAILNTKVFVQLALVLLAIDIIALIFGRVRSSASHRTLA